MNLEEEVKQIVERNKRVEADKAWETSGFRKILIFLITYIVASVWLYIIENNAPLLNALVPSLGWLLSTLMLPSIKTWWIKKNI